MSRTDVEQSMTDGERDSWRARVGFWRHTAENVAAELEAKTTRTEAEQAVLDAMGLMDRQWLERETRFPWNGPAKAELARRGLK